MFNDIVPYFFWLTLYAEFQEVQDPHELEVYRLPFLICAIGDCALPLLLRIC